MAKYKENNYIVIIPYSDMEDFQQFSSLKELTKSLVFSFFEMRIDYLQDDSLKEIEKEIKANEKLKELSTSLSSREEMISFISKHFLLSEDLFFTGHLEVPDETIKEIIEKTLGEIHSYLKEQHRQCLEFKTREADIEKQKLVELLKKYGLPENYTKK